MSSTHPTIAAAVIARNESANIGPCLEQLGWADEVLVLDSCSADDTVARALAYTPHVHRRPFDDFPHQRNAALALLKSDWVLFVDADERVSSALAAEVRTTVGAGEASWARGDAQAVAGYWVPRRNIILGRWIKGGGWYPDHQLRLLKRGRAHYDERRKVHEVVLLDGEQAYLREPFVHLNYQRLGQLFAKQSEYAALEAVSLYERGLPGRPHSIVLQTLREFCRRYFTLGGWRDGGHGALLCGVVALYTGVAYAKLWRLRRADRELRRSPKVGGSGS